MIYNLSHVSVDCIVWQLARLNSLCACPLQGTLQAQLCYADAISN